MIPELLLRHVEVDGREVDVRTRGDRIAEVGVGLQPGPGAEVIDGGGGALVPGLHDHHLHLMATAARQRSVPAGPPAVRDRHDLRRALHRAEAEIPAGGWIRAVGYHEAVAGDLDRHALDALLPSRPVRVQDRSGARWTLNSAAIAHLGLRDLTHAGLERDADGEPTGRLHRADTWLRDLLEEGPPDLAPLGRLLAQRGVTGVTDATPYSRSSDLGPLADAAGTALPQRLVVTGGIELAGATVPAGLEQGPVKLVIDDAGYPDPDHLAQQIGHAHGCDRPVAIHCVTRTAAVLALVAWDAAGSRPGDRMEHGAVLPGDLVTQLRSHRITVVTQPALVAERGDDYLRHVDPDDRAHLYPLRSLLDAGVPVGGSTDSPYTDPNPWRAMRAAVARTTDAGRVLGARERVRPDVALGLFLGDPHDPGGPPRTVAAGHRADLCLLHAPLATALDRLHASDVAATICAGRTAYLA